MTPATSQDRQQEQAFTFPQHIVTRRKSFGRSFQVGDKIEAEDSQKKWYPARILEVDEQDNCVLIHFNGFNARYDEWIEMASPKLRLPVRRGRDKTALLHLRIGEAVLARWTDGKFYPARITEISDESYRVEFYDGYSRTLSPNHIRPVDASQIRSHSRSGSSGRSSGETGNTPTYAGKSSHRQSRSSSVLSSAATTPLNSHPVSPAENGNGEHTPTNGHSHPILTHQTLRLSKGSIGSDIQHSSGDLLAFRCSTVVSSCGMSSTPVLGCQDSDTQSSSEPLPVVNGGGSHKRPECPSPRGLNGSTVPGQLGTGISHHVAAAASVYPAESRLIAAYSAAAVVTTHNGFHTNAVSARAAVTAAVMCPYEPATDVGGTLLREFSADMVTPTITPPTLPDFTPLSPNSSPRRQPVAPVLHHTSMSPLAGGAAASSAHASAVAADCPSPSSDGVMSSEPLASYHPECRPSTSIASPTSAAPTSVVTPNDSPVVQMPSTSYTRSTSSVLPSGVATDVSQASAANTRHHEAPPPVSSRHRTDSETSNSGRPKRRKVDGVLAPPPAKIAPKEVIAVEDHNPYKCKVCDKSFRKWPLVESHYKHYHPDNQRDFALAKKEYEKRPALAAVVTPDVDQSLKMAQKKRTTATSKAAAGAAAAAASQSTPDVPVVRQRSSSTAQAKRRDTQDVVVTLRQSSAPAVLVGELASLPPSPAVSSLPRQLSSPASASSAPPTSVAPARAKRKSSNGDGLPAKRGRPPLSLSAEHTPHLPVVLAGQPELASTTPGSRSKNGAATRELPMRLPGKSSRRSLSFSSDVSRDEPSPENEIPLVKMDGGFVDLPPDALLCCPCRQETFQSVHVKCTGCRTYQHLMCLPSSSIRQSWSQYQCRTCTHPQGKRRGARDKLPVDWYTSQSLCRNPMPLLAPPELQRSSGVAPWVGGSRPGVDWPLTAAMIQSDEESCILASKLVDLQHSASQDVLAVGEVLSATMKQLEVITHPDKLSNRAALNRLLPPRVKTDSLVSPIRIKTEPIGGIVQSTQSLVSAFAGRDGVRDPRAMKAGGLAVASPGRSPVISPVRADSVGLLGSAVPSLQQLVDGHGLSHPPSVTPPVTTTRPVSPTVVSRSRMAVSPQSAVSGAAAAASMRRSPGESPLLGNGTAAALPPLLLSRQQVLASSAASTAALPAQQQQQQQQQMSSRLSAGRGSPMPMDVDVSKPHGAAPWLRDAREFDDTGNVAHDPRAFSPISRSASGTSLQPQLANGAVRSPVQSQAKAPALSVAEAGGSKGKRGAATESEDENNFRVQSARTELLSRVHDIHGAVGNRLTLLEELLGDLESLEENFRCQGPLGCDMSKQQQLAVFQNLVKSVGDLEQLAPP